MKSQHPFNVIIRLSPCIYWIMILIICSLSVSYPNEPQKLSYMPKNGYVPDKETAIKIAVAVWIPIYGKKQIEKQAPYKATLKNNVWIVTGSMPKRILGGVALAEISKKDGRIIRVIHGR